MFSYEKKQTLKVNDKTLMIYNPLKVKNNCLYSKGRNVELFDADCKSLWIVNGMQKHELWNENDPTSAFVGVVEKNGCYKLQTFRGDDYKLDIATGEVTYSGFSK